MLPKDCRDAAIAREDEGCGPIGNPGDDASGHDDFDEEANHNQSRRNAGRVDNLAGLAAGLDAMAQALGPAWNETAVIAVTEFGRTVSVNGTNGTDHGTAEPLFIVGSAVTGGVYGDYPSMTNLDSGDLKFTVDFRNVYSTVLDRWLSADSQQVLGAKFDHLKFV